jgi:hypothetical protein
METYFNPEGVECVIVHNADGSTWSGYKSAYDEMQVEDLTEIPIADEA